MNRFSSLYCKVFGKNAVRRLYGRVTMKTQGSRIDEWARIVNQKASDRFIAKSNRWLVAEVTEKETKNDRRAKRAKEKMFFHNVLTSVTGQSLSKCVYSNKYFFFRDLDEKPNLCPVRPWRGPRPQ